MELYTAGGRRWTYTSLHCLQTAVFAAIPVLYTIAESPLENLLESLLASLLESLLESLFERLLESLLERASHREE
jgi:hypothetical protein